ncbi:MAG: chromosome partitioning protein ParB [Planctomycetes bacterium]|nr:chromosome partitioning protein ParB [Planctomycetota bacterium]
MERRAAGEVEIASVDLRYERCRVRDVRAERELLAEISMRGIERPLSGVESGARWILIDGFKRFRCARSLGMGSVPCASLGADEAAGIIEVLKGPGWKPLGLLEEARFLKELNSVHGMSLGEMAAALGRSKSWASMRLAALADMSEAVRDRIFRGSFPARAWMYVVRPFTRVNAISMASTDAFVKATSGRGYSVREIERLARAYFCGSADTRREIESGHAAMALGGMACPAGGMSGRERACLQDLERLARAMETLALLPADPKLGSPAFRAQAHMLLAAILARAGGFVAAMRRFHDRCGAA